MLIGGHLKQESVFVGIQNFNWFIFLDGISPGSKNSNNLGKTYYTPSNSYNDYKVFLIHDKIKRK